jgi:hypothetical protein
MAVTGAVFQNWAQYLGQRTAIMSDRRTIKLRQFLTSHGIISLQKMPFRVVVTNGMMVPTILR